MDIDGSTFLQTMLGASVSLMSISITLVAFVSALVEFASQRSSDFLSSELSKRSIKSGLSRLRITIWLYGCDIILCTGGLFLPLRYKLLIIVILFIITALFLTGTVILIVVSYILTSAALSTLS